MAPASKLRASVHQFPDGAPGSRSSSRRSGQVVFESHIHAHDLFHQRGQNGGVGWPRVSGSLMRLSSVALDGHQRIANLVGEMSRHLPMVAKRFLLHEMVVYPLARLAQNQQEANQLVEVVGQKQRLDAHRDQASHRRCRSTVERSEYAFCEIRV